MLLSVGNRGLCVAKFDYLHAADIVGFLLQLPNSRSSLALQQRCMPKPQMVSWRRYIAIDGRTGPDWRSI